MIPTEVRYDILLAAGVEDSFEAKAWAPQVETDPNLPAILSGVMEGGVFAVIRAWQQDDVWIAVATISRNPALAIGALEPEEAERLRAETQTPQGASAPVGQEKVIGRSDPKLLYAPPVQPLDTAESVQADAAPLDSEMVSEITVEPLDCGPDCARLSGPEGTVENHKPPCEHA
jgi:hypothetical protein